MTCRALEKQRQNLPLPCFLSTIFSVLFSFVSVSIIIINNNNNNNIIIIITIIVYFLTIHILSNLQRVGEITHATKITLGTRNGDCKLRSF